MITGHLAVFTGKDDDRVIKLSSLTQRIQHLANLSIYKRHIGEVLCPQSAPTVFGRQIVIVLDAKRIQVTRHVVVGSQTIEQRSIVRTFKERGSD